MKTSLLLRSGSVPTQLSIASPKGIKRSRSFIASPRSASPAEPKAKNIQINVDKQLRRARSDNDLLGSGCITAIAAFPVTAVVEEEEESLEMESGGGIGSGNQNGSGGGGGGGDRSENERVSEYYKRMLCSDPNNPLLLRNYGVFLHEVLGDAWEAEKCYSRAMLLSPYDGDLLALYAKLLWDQGEIEKAGHFFDRAAKAAPDNRYVLGMCAYFLWNVDEDEEDVEAAGVSSGLATSLRS
ncbi:hypothetical protein J5N97_018736 [Dioscorea zingiberensis]|uniref:TmcB/TmcC TPR repeats domain-containing protein n=1 Tax=Dioscorea zingiberensis TaxID=325984 RepID=A0A9D5CCQ3_9LILI|nr:hypothetical protein J5N97_018736 [Dioscorea zingiberensis]